MLSLCLGVGSSDVGGGQRLNVWFEPALPNAAQRSNGRFGRIRTSNTCPKTVLEEKAAALFYSGIWRLACYRHSQLRSAPFNIFFRV